MYICILYIYTHIKFEHIGNCHSFCGCLLNFCLFQCNIPSVLENLSLLPDSSTEMRSYKEVNAMRALLVEVPAVSFLPHRAESSSQIISPATFSLKALPYHSIYRINQQALSHQISEAPRL